MAILHDCFFIKSISRFDRIGIGKHSVLQFLIMHVKYMKFVNNNNRQSERKAIKWQRPHGDLHDKRDQKTID